MKDHQDQEESGNTHPDPADLRIDYVSDWLLPSNKRSLKKKRKRCTLTIKRSYAGISQIELASQNPSKTPLLRAYVGGSFFCRKGLFNIFSLNADEKDDEFLGSLHSPGWLSTSSILKNKKKQAVAGVHFRATSRDGKLMKMNVVVPAIRNLETQYVAAIIDECARGFVRKLPHHISCLISEFVGHLHWQDPLKNLSTKNIRKYAQANKDSCVPLENKKPVWNETISAYTLEFHGRALFPSVHNFQLVNERHQNTVLLQLGKFDEGKYNVDYRAPFTTLQAFAICVTRIACTYLKD